MIEQIANSNMKGKFDLYIKVNENIVLNYDDNNTNAAIILVVAV